MNYPMYGGTSAAATTGSTIYYMFANSSVSLASSSTESVVAVQFSETTTLSNFYVQLTTAPGGAASWTFNVMKNGSTSGITVTISGTATSGIDTINTATWNATDTISLQVVPASTPADFSDIWWNVVANGTGQVFLGIPAFTYTTTNINYFLSGGGEPTSSTLKPELWMPNSGTIKNLYMARTVAPGAGTSVTYTVIKNGSATGVTCTIADTATTANDTTNTATYVPGDRIMIQTSISGTPALGADSFGVSVVPVIDGQSLIGCNATTALATTGTQYHTPNNTLNWGTAETGVNVGYQRIIGNWSISRTYFRISTSAGASKYYDVTLRKNATDTLLEERLESANKISYNSIDIFQGDKLSISAVPTNTPTAAAIGVTLLVTQGPSKSGPVNNNYQFFDVGDGISVGERIR